MTSLWVIAVVSSSDSRTMRVNDSDSALSQLSMFSLRTCRANANALLTVALFCIFCYVVALIYKGGGKSPLLQHNKRPGKGTIYVRRLPPYSRGYIRTPYSFSSSVAVRLVRIFKWGGFQVPYKNNMSFVILL